MVKSLVCFAVLSLIVQVAVTHENEIKPNERKEGQDQRLSVVVRIRETVKGTLQTRGNKVTVHFKVTTEGSIVKVNDKPTELDVVTRYELDAEIEDSRNVRNATVIVHVLVVKKSMGNGHQFLLEEEVKLIEGKKVKQYQMALLTMHMDENGKEYKRTTKMVGYEESHIRQKHPKKFCGKGDRFPQEFYDEPKLPDESGFSHKKKGNGFCSKFHKLPFAARVFILVGVIFVLVTSVLCCAHFCCRKPKTVYNIAKEEKGDFEIEEEEAEPLPEKLSFHDKEVLIA